MPTSPSKPRCFITGCELEFRGQTVHGDLHELGDCYIFNACTSASQEPAWQPIHGQIDGQFVLTLSEYAGYFERKGIIVVSKVYCTLNQAANNYINKWN